MGGGSAYLTISVERAGGGRVGVLDDLRGAGGSVVPSNFKPPISELRTH